MRSKAAATAGTAGTKQAQASQRAPTAATLAKQLIPEIKIYQCCMCPPSGCRAQRAEHAYASVAEVESSRPWKSPFHMCYTEMNAIARQRGQQKESRRPKPPKVDTSKKQSLSQAKKPQRTDTADTTTPTHPHACALPHPSTTAPAPQPHTATTTTALLPTPAKPATTDPPTAAPPLHPAPLEHSITGPPHMRARGRTPPTVQGVPALPLRPPDRGLRAGREGH